MAISEPSASPSGFLVGDEQEPLGAQHLLDDLLEARRGGRRAHCAPSPSPSSFSTRNALSTVSSRMKLQLGRVPEVQHGGVCGRCR